MTGTTVARILSALEARGLRFRESHDGFTAQCPAHEDRHPSLSISEGADGRALLFCHAGCGFEDVLAALGLLATDAFAEGRPAVGHAVRSVSTPSVDAHALWNRMAVRDDEGERYLSARGLLVEPVPSAVLRFNRGRTGNPFVDVAARRGYRIAFAVRDLAGRVSSISFRHAGDGVDWGGATKTKLALKGRPTRGVAIARPEVSLLLLNDPEFSRDEIILCEGGTDWLAATLANDLAAIESRVPPAWVLGCIGASNAASVVTAFAPAIRGRTLRLWLDRDEAGERAVVAAVAAARQVGARSVRRYRPTTKDVAGDLQTAGTS